MMFGRRQTSSIRGRLNVLLTLVAVLGLSVLVADTASASSGWSQFGLLAAAIQAVAAPPIEDQRVGDSDAAHSHDDDTGHSDAGHQDSAADGHGDGHGGHDLHDLSHGNAGPNLENPADWKYDMAIYTFVVFLIMLAILGKFAWAPIRDGLDRREQAIATTIAESDERLSQANQRLSEYEERLASAGEESRQIIEAARKDAEAVASRIQSEAEDAAKRERERAVKEIELATEQALQGLADHVAQNVFLVAGKVLSREVQADDHRQLIQESIKKFPSKN